MDTAQRTGLEALINQAFEDRNTINTDTQGEVRDAVNATLMALDSGILELPAMSFGSLVSDMWRGLWALVIHDRIVTLTPLNI